MRVLSVLVVAACGAAGAPIVKEPAPEPRPVRPGVPPSSDEAALRAQLGGDGVQNTGLWFTDAECRAQFGTPGRVGPEAFDAFARCVAALHLRPTGRAHWADDASVLTDDAGFEIEARVVDGKLVFIGYAGRAPGMPDLPTITPEALEALRTGGDAHATITGDVAKGVVLLKKPGPAVHDEHLRVCLDESGAVNHVMPSQTTSVASAKAFAALVGAWRFRPFMVANVPTAVCAIASFRYPAGAPERKLPRPPALSRSGRILYTVQPQDLELKRVKGQIQIVPDDDDMGRIHATRHKRVVGSFRLCLDETGHYESGTLLVSTGLPGFDAKIIKTMMTWQYRPYLSDGVAIPVCTTITFIYSQTWK